MSDRALAIAACVLALGLVIADSNDDRRRVVISGPDIYHTDWDTDWDDPNLYRDLDDLDTELEALDEDEDSSSVYIHKAEARQLAHRERMRLRNHIRELRERAREHAERMKAEWRAEFDQFHGARRQVHEDFRSFGRDMREEGRQIRGEMRVLREHLREVRRQMRESVREAVRNKDSRRINIELD